MKFRISRKRRKMPCYGHMFALALVLFGLISALPISPRGASAEGTGTVFVHVYGCAADMIDVTDHDYLDANCDGSPFYNNLYLVSEGNETKGTADSENLDWTWNNVPAHIFGIKAQVEPYYAKPTVYCQDGDDDHMKLMETTIDAQYGYAHPTVAGGYVVCDWFAKTGASDKTASITIDTFDCPVGTNGDTSSMNDLYAACKTPMNGLDLTVESYLNPISGKSTGADEPGNAYWPNLTPDFAQITAVPLSGYVTPRVFCSSNVVQQGYLEFKANNWTFPYNLLKDETFTCDWYNIPAASATVQINNHLCPSGPDLRTADVYTLAQTCQMNMNGISFELKSAKDSRANITGDSAGSAIKWFDVAPGATNIHETQFTGYLAPRVFCSSTSMDSDDATDTTEIPVTSDAIDLTIDGGAYLFCDWFNLPDSGVAQAGTVMVYPVACPEGFDAANSTLQKSAKKCKTPQDLTDFQLVTQNAIYQLKSGWWESGVVIFYGIGTDQGLTLTATPRDGFQTAAVYCGQSLDSDGQVNGYDRLPTTDTNTIFPVVVPGAQEICQWFMVPTTNAQPNLINGEATPEADVNTDENGDNGDADTDQGDTGSDELLWTGRVEITNRVCPVGFDPSSQDLDSNCWDDANGFGFNIYSADQWWPQTSGDWADQMVIWDPVPVQDVIVQESVPGGFGTPIVFCGGQQMDVSGDGSINLTVNDGDVISCTWFNVQE